MMTTIYTIPAPDSVSAVIEVYGEPENAWYEWRILESGRAVRDTGNESYAAFQGRQYGQAEIALRDALMFASGLSIDVSTAVIHASDYPQLRQLARQLSPDAILSEREAFSIYEREWPHVDQARLDVHEKGFIRHLIATCGHGVFLVDGDIACLSERTTNAF